MARAQKENQKNPQRGGTPTPLSAAARTLAAYKHQCIHCGGWCPCVPETLVAWSTDEDVGAPGTDALSATTEAGVAEQSATVPLAAVDESADVALEEEWREAILRQG